MLLTQKSLNAGRKQAQRLYKNLSKCERCGGTETLHRHHIDHNTSNNTSSNIAILCIRCHGSIHANQHWKDHTKDRICLYCGTQFTYKRPREKTCSRQCGNKLAWMKRRSFQELLEQEQQLWTDLKPLAMDKFHCVQQLHGVCLNKNL